MTEPDCPAVAIAAPAPEAEIVSTRPMTDVTVEVEEETVKIAFAITPPEIALEFMP